MARAIQVSWPGINCYHMRYRLLMAKIRRGNYIFLSWKGDHSPRHVHVYRNRRLVVKWDLENAQAMEGKAGKRVLKLIDELEAQGLL
jgi:hypothetical protein